MARFRTCGNLRRTTWYSSAPAPEFRPIACGHGSSLHATPAGTARRSASTSTPTRVLRRDHRRPALPRRPQRRAAADDAAGLPGPQRRAAPGHARDAREAAPQAPRRARRYDLGGVYDDIAAGAARRRRAGARGASTTASTRPAQSGDQRRAGARRAGRRRSATCSSTCSRPTSPARSASCRVRVHVAARRAQRFEELMDQLRQQLMQSYFNQMAGACRTCRPSEMQRMKDMLAELNEMLEQRERGEEPDFEGFMERFGDFFPENPQTLDELLEKMAAAHGGDAGDAQLDDARAAGAAAGARRAAARGHGPALADRPARPEPAAACSRRWAGTGATTSSGQDPLGFAEAGAARCSSSATSTSSRTCCAARPTRARWPRSTSTGSATCSATTPPARSSGSPSWPRCSRRPA